MIVKTSFCAWLTKNRANVRKMLEKLYKKTSQVINLTFYLKK